jgi:hypothetical protein
LFAGLTEVWLIRHAEPRRVCPVVREQVTDKGLRAVSVVITELCAGPLPSYAHAIAREAVPISLAAVTKATALHHKTTANRDLSVELIDDAHLAGDDVRSRFRIGQVA